MSDPVQMAAERRRRPLVQYVISKRVYQLPAKGMLLAESVDEYWVHRSPTGTKPSHHLIHRPTAIATAPNLHVARQCVPPGYKRLDRRKDDPVDVVEVWV